jgi:predicted metal-dependent peptidase
MTESKTANGNASDNDGTHADSLLHQSAKTRSEQALRFVSLNMPWLSPLVYAVQLFVDARVSVAAVTQSGRILVNPQVFSTISLRDATYIMAHELLHLAMDTFSRETSFDNHETVNIAHDYVINDLLRIELGMDPPLGGLNLHGASQWSLEQVVSWMKHERINEQRSCWEVAKTLETSSAARLGALGAALRDAGLMMGETSGRGGKNEGSGAFNPRLDVIFPAQETAMFPQAMPAAKTELLKGTVLKVLALKGIAERICSESGGGHGNGQLHFNIADVYAHPPWESVLQRWLESFAPGTRTYARPSRRGADRTDCVLPGRNRGGWTLHLVLDTSGSMLSDLPLILATIKSFCTNSGVAEVHVVQCGDELTADDWVLTDQLHELQLIGGGGGNLVPGFDRLAKDSEVEAALIITDTYEAYPSESPPYAVLWAVVRNKCFQPPYGTSIFIETRES